MKKLLVLASLLLITVLEAKVLIITHSYNRPDFIEIQDKTFKKFLKDDYEFVVFNDAPSEKIAQEIAKTCQRLDLSCVRIPQNIHTKPYLKRWPGEDNNHPVVRCANVVQYSLDVLGFEHPGLVAIIDSDIFLINDFSIEDYLKDSDIAGLPQRRGEVFYIWNGLVFFNMGKLPNKQEMNFNAGSVDGIGTDVGGHMHYYFKNHPEVKLKGLNVSHISQIKLPEDISSLKPSIAHFIHENPSNVEFLVNFNFFHYRGGGNWNNQTQQYHDIKTQLVAQFLKDLLEE